MIAYEDFTYPIPNVFTDFEAAPLLCAGAIGYRALKLTGMRGWGYYRALRLRVLSPYNPSTNQASISKL